VPRHTELAGQVARRRQSIAVGDAAGHDRRAQLVVQGARGTARPGRVDEQFHQAPTAIIEDAGIGLEI
jgi:hypothetical protein